MVNPEHGAGSDRRNLFEAIKQLLNKILGKKRELELKEALEAQKDKKKAETIEERKRQAEERKKNEEARAYRERRSDQVRSDEVDLDRIREQIQAKTYSDASEELDKAIEQPKPDIEKGEQSSGYEASDYIFDQYRDKPELINPLKDLMRQNPKIAEVIYELAKKDTSAHENASDLLKLGKTLINNTPDSQRLIVDPVLNELKIKVNDLVKSDAMILQASYRDQRDQEIKARDARSRVLANIAEKTGSYLTEEQKNQLKNEAEYEQAINNILFTKLEPVGSIHPTDRTIREPKSLATEAVKDIDRIWDEVEQAELSGTTLSLDRLEELRRKIYAAESASYPEDIIPGSHDYLRAVNEVRNFTEDKLNHLAELFAERLKVEGPPIKTTDVDEFLKQLAQRPGNLGYSLLNNQEIYKIFIGTDKNSYHFRNRLFLQIHSSVLSQRREASYDNFGLYERADFTTFTTLLRDGLKRKVPETGESAGQTWVDWYTGLSNTIRHSRDIDFYTSQPGATMENLNKSMIMFQNEYTSQAMSIPAVETAYRAYENALQIIRDNNDGYIPPGLIDYNPARMASYWDQTAQNLLSKMVNQGVVKDVRRDFDRMGGMPMLSPDGVSFELGDELKQIDPLELKMFMTLAKGFGMVSMRLPEIIANTKIPGFDVPGFRSPAFEGIITALNHWNVFIKKWSVFTYKYFYMINTVLPEHKRLPVGKGGAEIVYRHLLDGTFKDRYGEKALTMIGSLNFTRTHGALGPTTPWRTMDNSIGWTDKQRELLGGPTRILLAGPKLADEMMKTALIEQKYKEKFRKIKREQGQAYSGADFEALWLSEGLSLYGNVIIKEWEEYRQHHKKELQVLKKNFTRVYKARMWIETAMKNPLAIAHNVDVELPIAGYEGKTQKRKLSNYIVEQVLGIPPEDLETGSVTADGEQIYKVNAAKYATPTERQRKNLDQVVDLEGDMAAVKERALEENREITLDDFNIIRDDIRRGNAIEYWRIVKQYISGERDFNSNDFYKKLGIVYHTDPKTHQEMEYYNIAWEKMQHADENIFNELRRDYKNVVITPEGGRPLEIGMAKAFDQEFLDRDWHWYFSTDDTSFRRMDFLNLGNRQWVRRGGDVQAHYVGGLEVDEYLDHSLLPNPDVHELAKQLYKIRKGYQGDAAEIGFRIAGNLAYLTGKLYEFIPARLGSVAQLDVWEMRRNVAAWTANKRREFWDAIEHEDAIPPHANFEHFLNPLEFADVQELRYLNHAGDADVWTEIILLGMLVALGMTVWRAFTAKSEDEEDGGGHR